ncbi:alpha/beta fold hydrolase, partial [Streptomyces sp. NPDC058953]
ALVLEHAGALLGYSDDETIETHRTFLESGFDSLTAVELRNRLNSVIALCTPSAMGGPYQFARLGASFRGVRGLSALPVPGFAPDEGLPETADAVVNVLAEAVRRAAGDRPPVLLGYSSSGVIAYAVAERPERIGSPARAVVLLDTPRLPRPGDRHADASGPRPTGSSRPTPRRPCPATTSAWSRATRRRPRPRWRSGSTA